MRAVNALFNCFLLKLWKVNVARVECLAFCLVREQEQGVMIGSVLAQALSNSCLNAFLFLQPGACLAQEKSGFPLVPKYSWCQHVEMAFCIAGASMLGGGTSQLVLNCGSHTAGVSMLEHTVAASGIKFLFLYFLYCRKSLSHFQLLRSQNRFTKKSNKK